MLVESRAGVGSQRKAVETVLSGSNQERERDRMREKRRRSPWKGSASRKKAGREGTTKNEKVFETNIGGNKVLPGQRRKASQKGGTKPYSPSSLGTRK